MRLFLMIGLLVVGLIAFITTHNIWYFIVPAFIYAITMFRPKKNSASVVTEKTEIQEEEKNLWEGYDQAFPHSTSSPSLEVEEEDYVFEDKEDTEDDLFDDVEDDFGLDDTLFDDIDSELSELDKELEEEVFSPAQQVAATTEEKVGQDFELDFLEPQKVETPISDDVLDELVYQPETEEKQTMDEFDELFFEEDVSNSPSTVVEVEEDPDLLPEEEWGLQDVDHDDIDLFIPDNFVKEEKGEKGLEEIKQKALSELNQLIGMDDLKEEVLRVVKFLEIEKKKEKAGKKTKPVTLHMVFKGDAGTGKTTVARIIADLLKGVGVLESGHYIETDRSGLVASYVGQTAEKTKELVQQAMGGVLFIDEAYALASGGPQDFGQEAIDTLIPELENHRDKFVCILAGYEEDMQRLFEKNQGFESRVRYHFDFPNYSIDELMELAKLMMKGLDMKPTLEAQEKLRILLEEKARYDGHVKGNGRTVRNIIDAIHVNQNNRISDMNIDDFETVLPEDIPTE